MKPGRNDPCPCGSGRKYKSCCLGRDAAKAVRGRQVAPAPGAIDARQLVAMFHVGRHPELESLLRVLIERAPHSGFLWGLFGATMQAQGKDGLPALQRATTLSPDDFDAQAALGLSLIHI